jgi:hypothetical protein
MRAALDGSGGGTGCAAGGTGVGAPRGGGSGVIPGSVLRGTCGGAADPGRGGENEGRTGTAEDDNPGTGGLSRLGLSFSLIRGRSRPSPLAGSGRTHRG